MSERRAGSPGAEPITDPESSSDSATRRAGASQRPPARSALATCCALLLVAITACGSDEARRADRVRVAVASNFLRPMQTLARSFEQETGIELEIGAGSTGLLYAQIRAGAPFDVFLAADAERPARLVESGLARRASLRRYATGRLAVIVHDDDATPDRPSADAAQTSPPACLTRILAAPDPVGRRVAIASPETAPYGRAARQTLEALGLWTSLSPRLVRGENVSQTYHFVVSGNAAAGFVAASQLATDEAASSSSCRWLVPETLHGPIVQKMVVLERSADRPAVQEFARFMAGRAAARIIRDAGYEP